MRRLHWIGALSLLVGLSFSFTSVASSRPPVDPPGFTKVSTTLAEQWRATGKGKRAKVWVECFVMLAGQAGNTRLQELEDAGFVSRSVIPKPHKTILTGRLLLKHLPQVTALAYVEVVEGAARVGLK
jgi:hypothetical protein